MKLVSKEIKNKEFIYNGFVQGSNTDKDVIARACGYFSGDIICSVKLKFESEKEQYFLNIDFEAQGEQKLLELDDIEEMSQRIGLTIDDIENSYDYARKNKVTQEKDVKIITKIFEEYPELFSSNCWYEGVISLSQINKKTQEKEKLIDNKYESELGLEGVLGSIQDIHDKYNNDEDNIELVEWLLEEYV